MSKSQDRRIALQREGASMTISDELRDGSSEESRHHLTQDLIRQMFHYEPITGIFTRRLNARQWKAGQRSGSLTKRSGYRYITINHNNLRFRCCEHRLAWFYMTGKWPGQIDHRSGDRSDNSWQNLRECDSSENQQNRFATSSNKSGYPGVHWNKTHQRWVAKICIRGERKYLGEYVSVEAAANAYLEGKRKFHTFANFARLESPEQYEHEHGDCAAGP